MRITRCLTLIAAVIAMGVAVAQNMADDYDQGPNLRLPEGYSMGPVAVVGPNRIGADMVFELWRPFWQETQAKVRNGKMSAAEGDAKLHEEWERAVRALVKDELFFQEAEREHNSFINAIVERFSRGGDPRPRSQIAADVRRMMQQDMDKSLRQFNAMEVKRSGGMLKLHKVLEGRGLTYAEWQTRLKKRAFTEFYLHQILKPRAPNPGPRQVQQYYASHPDEFSRPGTVKFRHVFFSTAKRGEEEAREDAVQTWEMLVDGEIDFETAVARYSDDEVSKPDGGLETEDEASDPEREAWLGDIRNALREESPGEIGPILESPFGFHVATLISIGPDQRIPFQEVRREIEGKLTGKVWEEETDRYFASIRKNTPIRVLMPDFPQHLSCAVLTGAPQRGPRIYSTSMPQVYSPRGGRR